MLTRKEVQGRLRCSPRHLDELLATNELVSIQRKRGRSESPRLIPSESFIAFCVRHAKIVK